MSETMNPFAKGLKELGLVASSPSESTPTDPLAPMVREVIDEILRSGDLVVPIDVLVRLEILTSEQILAWRRGQLPYLERGITAGLTKVARLLRALEETALAMGLVPAIGKYMRSGKGPKKRLRFSKRGDATSEAAYARQFVRSGRSST